MKAMMMKNGKASSLKLHESNNPTLRDDEVLLKVVASGVNRCDLQTEESDEDGTSCGCFSTTKKPHYYYCPGHECSGTIIAIGRFVTQWNVGDKVCAILDKGGYAEQVAVNAKHLLPIPTNVSFADAAGLPFSACNIWLALFDDQEEGATTKTVLIHDGASKFGSMAIQFAKYNGIKVIATTRSKEHLNLCNDLGADACFYHNTENLVDYDDDAIKEARSLLIDNVMKETRSIGVDLILDNGLPNIRTNLKCLTYGGKLMIVDFLRQRSRGYTMPAIVSLTDILIKNSELQVSDIRAQSTDRKAFIIGQVQKLLWPAIEQGKVRPVVCRRLPLTAARAATKSLDDQTISSQNVILYS